jgi:pyruvate carboxylase
MHTSYKELNNGIVRKEGISNQEQKAVTKSCNNQQRPKDLKQNESRMRTESWHRVRKEEHEGESECRVSKAVLVKFGCQTNEKQSEEMKQRTSFLGLNQRFQKVLLQKY